MMVPLIMLGFLMVPPLMLRLVPPKQVGLGVCMPGPVVLGDRYIGVAPGLPWRQSALRFAAAVGARPGMVENYTLFGAPFNEQRACQVTQLGAVPLIQVIPRNDSLAAIASGRYDGYLETYARAVRAFKDPVVLSFAHEMNARWWPWGYQHTSPAVFVAAWRHVWDVFARVHARNVTWLWNVNRDAKPGQEVSISPPRDWWPGRRYVDWVGIDAYFNTPADTFGSVFGDTLAGIRRFTSAPVLIAETAIAPGPRQTTQIHSLFAGVNEQPEMLGFIWFDLNRRETWKLEGRPDALAVFRAEMTQYNKSQYRPRGNEWKVLPAAGRRAAAPGAYRPETARPTASANPRAGLSSRRQADVPRDMRYRPSREPAGTAAGPLRWPRMSRACCQARLAAAVSPEARWAPPR
jgi:Glycosyl hydrolase family 26